MGRVVSVAWGGCRAVVCFVAGCVFAHMPAADPRKFMIDYLENLKNTREGKEQVKPLFDEQNCQALFRVFDRSGAGHISMDQYREGVPRPLGLLIMGKACLYFSPIEHAGGVLWSVFGALCLCVRRSPRTSHMLLVHAAQACARWALQSSTPRPMAMPNAGSP